jgi:hypothetical protein
MSAVTPGEAMALDLLSTPYATEAYAASLAHVGAPFRVDALGTWMTARPIAGSDRFDVAGAYPVAVLSPDADFRRARADLIAAGAVSLVLVLDPCFGPPAERVAEWLSFCRPYKTHYVIDRALGPIAFSKHHQQEIRKAERGVVVREVNLAERLDRWCALYDHLVRRHGISGPAAFGRAAFEALVHVPGLVALAAEAPDGTTVAMQLWLRHGNVAYNHLAASSAEGYRLLAAYALYAAAERRFADCRLLDLGGGGGSADDPADGLAKFKNGFANATLMSHLAGAVLDPIAYELLSSGREGAFFPLYRMPRRQAAAE